MKRLCFLIPIFLLLACQKNTAPETSFYYWRTTFDLSAAEREAMKSNAVSNLYVRYFDLDFDKVNGIIPRAPIRFSMKPEVSVVPVLYLKNEIFTHNVDLDDLARKCLKLIDDINRSVGISNDEIQLDCDWTECTKPFYFKFIDIIKQFSGKKISATIRLHQIKYPDKTGIPNVDKGVLMYYNMSSIATSGTNSIYDRKTALQYIRSLSDYPIQLDVALPVYSWGVLIRDGRVIGLKRKEDLTGIDSNVNFKVDGSNFNVKASHYFHGTYYQKNDVIKIESVSGDQLYEMAQDIAQELARQPEEVIFYDLDEFNLNRYEADIFSETTSGF